MIGDIAIFVENIYAIYGGWKESRKKTN